MVENTKARIEELEREKMKMLREMKCTMGRSEIEAKLLRTGLETIGTICAMEALKAEDATLGGKMYAVMKTVEQILSDVERDLGRLFGKGAGDD